MQFDSPFLRDWLEMPPDNRVPLTVQWDVWKVAQDAEKFATSFLELVYRENLSSPVILYSTLALTRPGRSSAETKAVNVANVPRISTPARLLETATSTLQASGYDLEDR